MSLAEQSDPAPSRALETVAHYLGRGMRIIIVCELTRAWKRFGPVIEAG